MNRRQKIIVSVTGIFIVLLVLLGLTYAYFLTRITGNSNPTSISVTTANLELVYGDGTTAILTSSNPIMPSSTPIGTKDFTVTNNGDDSEYVVVFEDVTVKYAADTVINGQAVTAGTDTTFESNDFVYTLTCEVKDKSGNTLSDKSCDGVEKETFPMDGGIVIGNSIDKDDVHNYVLTLYYLDNGLDQSADMNKALNGKVNIKDIKSINPYSDNTSSLAYNIINNSILNKNGTQLVATPPSKVAEETSLENWELGQFVPEKGTYKLSDLWYSKNPEANFDTCWMMYLPGSDGWEENCSDIITEVNSCEELIGYTLYNHPAGNKISSVAIGCDEDDVPYFYGYKYESILSVTQDDYGTSYYYRGNVEDNYVTFSNMCWRIVRIQGDGSIKLTLESQSPCSETMTSNFPIGGITWGYKEENDKHIGDYKNSTNGMKNKLTTWLNEIDENGERINITTKAEELLKTEEWCLGNTANTYAHNSPYALLGTTAYENHLSGKAFFYETGRNLAGSGITPNATLVCNGETDSSKIGALTADEVAFAGGKAGTSNINYYLQNADYGFWTLSRYDFSYESGNGSDYVFSVALSGELYKDHVNEAMFG